MIYILGKGAGVAMGAEHLLFVRDAERFEGLAARGHYVPVAGATHYDCYFHFWKNNLERVIGSMYLPSL